MSFPSPLWLAGLMVAGGTAHFVAPGSYERVIPAALGSPRPWVAASGVAEIAAGLMLAAPRTRRFGGAFTAGVLVVVFPANVKMALDSGGIWWARLPFQIPLAWWALREGRQPAAQEKRETMSANSSAGEAGRL